MTALHTQRDRQVGVETGERADRWTGRQVPGRWLRRMVLVEVWYLLGGAGGDSVPQGAEPLPAEASSSSSSSSSPWNWGRSHRPGEGAWRETQR